MERTSKIRIAIALAARSGLHETVGMAMHKIVQSARYRSGYESTLFFTSFNQEVIQRQILQMIEQKYDYIFAIGRIFTDTIKQYYDECEAPRELPIVIFSGVKWPVEFGIVSSLRAPGGRLTGVKREGASPFMQAYFIRHLPMNLKSIAVLYDRDGQGGYLSEQAHMTQAYLHQHTSIHCELFALDDVDEIKNTLLDVFNRKDKPDMILNFEGGSMSEYVSQVSELCWQYEVPLFGEGHEAVREGAYFGYGGGSEVFARKSIQLIDRIAQKNLDPAVTPVVFTQNNRSFFINYRVLRAGIIDHSWITRVSRELGAPIEVIKDEDTLNGYE